MAYNDNNIVIMNHAYETKPITKMCIFYSICYASLFHWYHQLRFPVGKISTHMCMCCDDLSNRSLCNSYVRDHSRYGLNQWGRRYIVTSSLIGWSHAQNDPYIYLILLLPGTEPCQCLNGGFCPDPRLPTQCTCPQPYYGTLCESRKYKICFYFQNQSVFYTNW